MIELFTWYFNYLNLNATGVRHIWSVVFGILFIVLRKAVSRALVLAVGLGYGVIRYVTLNY